VHRLFYNNITQRNPNNLLGGIKMAIREFTTENSTLLSYNRNAKEVRIPFKILYLKNSADDILLPSAAHSFIL